MLKLIAAFAILSSPAWAEAGKAGIQWVKIPGGNFMMGLAVGDEQPVHAVTIRPFEMAKTLVTNKQYKACVRAGACTPTHAMDVNCRGGKAPPSFLRDDLPVVSVDWNQARTFSKWVGGRLPSEAEWEYAAKSAGKDWDHPWGNEEPTCERAVLTEYKAPNKTGCGKGAPWPVCSKPAGNTRQGLCDMIGNAWEWVQDAYQGSYEGAPADGSAWEAKSSSRVFRGSSWADFQGSARSGARDNDLPGRCRITIGFRPAR
jgi:formylglycine-generating enzyme required for sulfatase activity